MNHPPRIGVSHHDSSIVIDTNIHANSVVPRKLNNRVISNDGEDESRLIVLNFNNRQGDFPLSEALIIESEN